MDSFDKHYRQVNDTDDVVRARSGERDRSRTESAVAIAAVGETTAYSDDLLLDHLESLLDDGLRAVWQADSTGIDPLHVADHVDLDEERMRALTDAFGSIDRDAIGETLREDVACVTITLAEHALYQFVVDSGHSTFVLVDEARGTQLPNFVRETRALLAARQE